MDNLEKEINAHAKYWDCYNDAPLEYNHTGKLVKIAEIFAINFAIWKESYDNVDNLPDKLLVKKYRKEYYGSV